MAKLSRADKRRKRMQEAAHNVRPPDYTLPRAHNRIPMHPVQQTFTTIDIHVDPTFIEGAQYNYGNGDFKTPGQLYNALFKDGAFAQAINKRVDVFMRCPLIITPGGPTQKDKDFADLVRTWMPQCIPDSEQRELLQQLHVMQTMIGTIEWTDDALPLLTSMHPMWLFNMPQDFTWTYQSLSEGRLKIKLKEKDPGAIDTPYHLDDEYGRIKSDLMPGDPNWFFFTRWKRGNENAPVCNLSEYWYYKKLALSKQAEALKSYCSPVEKVLVPANQESVEQGQQFYQEVLQNRDNKCLLIRQSPTDISGNATKGLGYDYKIESPGNAVNSELFDKPIEYYDRKFLITFLGSHLGTEVATSGGNRGAATVHQDVEGELIASDDRVWSACIQQMVLAPWAILYDPIDPPAIPNMRYDVSYAQAPQDKTMIWKQFGDAINSLLKIAGPTGLQVDNIIDMAAQCGIIMTKTTQTP